MYYYDPDNKSPRRWAMIATAVYGVLLAGSFALVSFDFSPVTDKPGDTILVDFTEPPVPEPPRPPVKVANEPRVHDVAAPVEQTAQVAGKDPVTQTPNPKALFKKMCIRDSCSTAASCWATPPARPMSTA